MSRQRDRSQPISHDYQISRQDRNSLSTIIDNINLNTLAVYYPKDESLFKKRIDKLNLKFYLETEKYLTTKNSDSEKCQDTLFMILFKQISLYLEEIDRLNSLIRDKNDSEKTAKDKIEELNRKGKDFQTSNFIIVNLKNTIKMLEKKLNERAMNEEKLRIEVDSYKRQIKFYKDKLQIELTAKKNIEINQNRVNNINRLRTNMENSITTNISDIRSSSKDSNKNKFLSKTLNQISSINVNLADNVPGSQNMSPTNQTNKKNQSNQQIVPSNNQVSSNTNNANSIINANLKILNKKRNYSDNNPTPKGSQIKKNIFSNVRNNNNTNENANFTIASSKESKQSHNNNNSIVTGSESKNTLALIINNTIYNSNKNEIRKDIKSPNRDGIANKKVCNNCNQPSTKQSTNKVNKDLGIIKAIKQNSKQGKISNLSFLDSYDDCTKFKSEDKLKESDFNLNSSSTMDSVREFILTSASNLEEELAELETLELMLLQAKNETGSYLHADNMSFHQELSRRAESVERYSKPFILSDAEEGYKSSNSCVSDKQVSFSNTRSSFSQNQEMKNKKAENKNPKISNTLNKVTIDLISKPLKPIQSSRKKFNIAPHVKQTK